MLYCINETPAFHDHMILVDLFEFWCAHQKLNSLIIRPIIRADFRPPVDRR